MPIRVLLTEMPELMRDLLSRILTVQAGLEVTLPAPEESWMETIHRTAPDVLISASQAESSESGYVDLLAAHPLMKVISIRTDGRSADLLKMQVARVPLGPVTVEELATVIRDVCGEPGGTKERSGS